MSRQETEELARKVVTQIWYRGVDSTSFEDPRTMEFANAALSELIALREGIPGIIENVLEGADLGASQLTVEDTQGLMELVQNADDQRASRLRFGVRIRSGRYQLVVAHDGDPITVRDVVAMCFAFVSTKRDDPRMKGKFGIGLKTLSRLADRIEVHCSPYHFAIAGNKVEKISRPRGTKFYDPQSADTLFVLPLKAEGLAPRTKQWVEARNAGDLLFLSYLRELSWVALPSGKVGRVHRLTERRTDRAISWRRSDKTLAIRKTEVHDRAGGLDWIRYDADVPVPKRLTRAFKAIGDTTTVSVAVPNRANANVLYAGLPTKISLDLPYVISAAFDPNTARTQIQQSKWNAWLWKRTAELVTALALSLLEEEPAAAWSLIPVSDESSVPVEPWVEERTEDMAMTIRNAVLKRGRITIGDSTAKLHQLSYGCEALDGLLANEDFAVLAPRHVRLPAEACDARGRWRAVADDLEIGRRLDVGDALDLLPLCVDRPLSQSPEWYIRLACAALDADLESQLEAAPCVLVDGPVGLLAPASSGSYLSIDSDVRPLAARLGLVRKLHGSLLAECEGSERIRAWLESEGFLWQRLDVATVLEAIANGGADEPIELSDDDLVELRDMIDDLDEPDAELLSRLGQSVVIDAYHWVKKRRVEIKAPVGLVYLPPVMSEADGWPRVAARTPGLQWAAPRYATLLDPGDRRSGKSGGRRFLGMLGASNVFRLVHQPNGVLGPDPLPTLQDRAFQQFLSRDEEFERRRDKPRSLRDDYTSPDLESVIEDICGSSKKERSDRGLALMRVLDRSWRRSLHQKSFCTANYFFYVHNDLGDLSASWIAKLADIPWLYNERELPARPIELTIRSPLTQALWGDAKWRFAAGVQDDLAPDLADALGFEQRPKASQIVDALGQLRAGGGIVGWEDVRSYYSYLASMCPSSTGPIAPKATVDDIGVARLRGHFGINSRARGLLFIDGAWRAPTAVLRGRAIFGDRRSFVPAGPYENLWNTLGIREPNVEDCIAVLEEIASNGGAVSEDGVLAETFRHLNSLLDSAAHKERLRLASVPLWSGFEWVTRRPIYYIADETAAQSLAATHDVWRPPCPLEEMSSLVEALGVTFIPPENCAPTGVESRSLHDAQSLTEEYSSAIEALKDYLARNDPEAYRGIDVDWRGLRNAEVVVAPDLGLEITLPDGGRVEAETNAHMTKDPLTLYLRDARFLFDHDAGGRAVSQCFGSSQHGKTVMLAWSSSYIQRRKRSSAMSLAEDVAPEEDPLDDLSLVAAQNVGNKITGEPKGVQDPTRGAKLPDIAPRRLKTLDSIRVKEARIVNRGASPGEHIPNKQTPPSPQTLDGPHAGTRASGGAMPTDYTADEREQLALQVLEGVVRDNKGKLTHISHINPAGLAVSSNRTT